MVRTAYINQYTVIIMVLYLKFTFILCIINMYTIIIQNNNYMHNNYIYIYVQYVMCIRTMHSLLNWYTF